jgi:hypothetical protein
LKNMGRFGKGLGHDLTNSGIWIWDAITLASRWALRSRNMESLCGWLEARTFKLVHRTFQQTERKKHQLHAADTFGQ